MGFNVAVFALQSIGLGIGLAMDAFSVSLANGLNEPKMPLRRMCMIAGVFGLFQALMPMIGWLCVHTVAQAFSWFERCIPWIALLLLGFIGGKMLYEGLRHSHEEEAVGTLTFVTLLVQGIATSIDALSVGFAIADYTPTTAVFAALIIAVVTFIVCMTGVFLGKKFGTLFAGRATVIGGIILIGIGLEIFLTGILG